MKLTPEDQKKLQDKELANIIRKLNGGKTLTAREEAKLAAASVGGQIDASGYVGTWDELGDRLGVTRRAIQDWRNDPRYKAEIEARWSRLTRADGRYCVAEWLQLMIDLHLKRGKAAAEAGNDPENAGEDAGGGIIRPPPVAGRKSEWDLAIAALDHRKKENAVLTLEQSLLVASELELPLGATFAAIQTKLAQFPARVARYLVGLRDVAEVEDRLREEIDADLGDLHAARYTADDAIGAAVAAVPFDAETAALCEKLLFAGSDRTALLELACAIARQSLRLLGQRAIAAALHEKDLPDTALADEKTGQVTEEATIKEALARNNPATADSPSRGKSDPAAAPGLDPSPAKNRPPAAKAAARHPKPEPVRSDRKQSAAVKRKRKTRPKPATGPGEIEGAIVNTRRKRR